MTRPRMTARRRDAIKELRKALAMCELAGVIGNGDEDGVKRKDIRQAMLCAQRAAPRHIRAMAVIYENIAGGGSGVHGDCEHLSAAAAAFWNSAAFWDHQP